ncbi:MAG: hypothetical protein JWP13_787, partial [Candidatus Saccharibacteria bacterium]|nr:hypothetical protein [Candidatus Saccharibacteria bacterium]
MSERSNGNNYDPVPDALLMPPQADTIAQLQKLLEQCEMTAYQTETHAFDHDYELPGSDLRLNIYIDGDPEYTMTGYRFVDKQGEEIYNPHEDAGSAEDQARYDNLAVAFADAQPKETAEWLRGVLHDRTIKDPTLYTMGGELNFTIAPAETEHIVGSVVDEEYRDGANLYYNKRIRQMTFHGAVTGAKSSVFFRFNGPDGLRYTYSIDEEGEETCTIQDWNFTKYYLGPDYSVVYKDYMAAEAHGAVKVTEVKLQAFLLALRVSQASGK